MSAHRPFMLVGTRGPEIFVPANDATCDESECVEDMAPGAAIVAFVAIWTREHWPALLVGFWLGTIVLALVEVAALGGLR